MNEIHDVLHEDEAKVQKQYTLLLHRELRGQVASVSASTKA